jgi:hypothetical protein
MVLAMICSLRVPSPMAVVQRSRLWARAAASSQAALALNLPEGRWASGGVLLGDHPHQAAGGHRRPTRPAQPLGQLRPQRQLAQPLQLQRRAHASLDLAQRQRGPRPGRARRAERPAGGGRRRGGCRAPAARRVQGGVEGRGGVGSMGASSGRDAGTTTVTLYVLVGDAGWLILRPAGVVGWLEAVAYMESFLPSGAVVAHIGAKRLELVVHNGSEEPVFECPGPRRSRAVAPGHSGTADSGLRSAPPRLRGPGLDQNVTVLRSGKSHTVFSYTATGGSGAFGMQPTNSAHPSPPH